MLVANAPLKFLAPWASQNTNIFELPQTTADPTRASQALGFPPETMLPPESGGVPPQGIDFNAGLYQVARITWWLMYGGPFAYDATFATNAAISGYPQGAEVASSDYAGQWLSTADNNQVNPDTVGTNWVPGYTYGRTAVALTNANVTLSPLQAAKKILVFTGTLTGNVVVTLPAWIYEWDVVNNTSGAFTLTLTTASGSGAVMPQGGASRIRGDGTNINFDAVNVPPGATPNQAAQLQQVQPHIVTLSGSGNWTCPAGVTVGWLSGCAGGGGGGASGSNNTANAAASGGGGGGAGQPVIRQSVTLVPGTVYAYVVGAAGLGGAAPAQGSASTSANNGTAGGNTTFGTLLTLTGGAGGTAGAAGAASGTAVPGGGGGTGYPVGGTASDGAPAPTLSTIPAWPGVSGAGASSPFGGGGTPTRSGNGASNHGFAAYGFGAGGSGGGAPYLSGSPGAVGGAGAPGTLILEY